MGTWVFFPFSLRAACLSTAAWTAYFAVKGHHMEGGGRAQESKLVEVGLPSISESSGKLRA